MARPPREELIGVRLEVTRFYMEMKREFMRLGYPKQAAFAKLAARGTVSLPPTAEDPVMDRIGRFINARTAIDRYILSSSVPGYDSRTLYIRAKSIGISTGRYSRELDKMLMELKGYLAAFDEMDRRAA